MLDQEHHTNGYRERPWDTRLGTIALPIPKLRHGSYFPQWLLEPRRRAERALVQVVADLEGEDFYEDQTSWWRPSAPDRSMAVRTLTSGSMPRPSAAATVGAS